MWVQNYSGCGNAVADSGLYMRAVSVVDILACPPETLGAQQKMTSNAIARSRAILQQQGEST